MFDYRIDIFQPPPGWGGMALLLLAGAGAVWLLYHPAVLHGSLSRGRRWTLIALRGMALLALLGLLAGPAVYRDTPSSTLRPEVVILADTSASMAVRDVSSPTGGVRLSRWQTLTRTWLAPSFLERLAQQARLRVLGFATRVQPLTPPQIADLTPQGTATDLFGAVDQVLSAPPEPPEPPESPGTLVILSDGHDTQRTDDPTLCERLRRSGWRVVTVPVGTPAAQPGLAFSARPQAQTVYDGQSTGIDIDLVQHGYSGRTVHLNLRENERLLASQTVALEQSPMYHAVFRLTPTVAPGQETTLHTYQVTAWAGDAPADVALLSRWVLLSATRRRIRVALFEGQPYWDTRFLARTLRDDAQVDLTTFTAWGPDRVHITHSGADSADAGAMVSTGVPSAEEVQRFDLIILGKNSEAFFPGSRAQILVDFVREQGGALVLARGRAFAGNHPAGREAQALFSPLEPLLWGERVNAMVRLTAPANAATDPLLDFGSVGDLRQILAHLPDLLTTVAGAKEKPAAVVLLRQFSHAGSAERDSPPPVAAVAYQYVGRGKVLALAGEGMWRWALLPENLREFDPVYRIFWTRMVRWLVSGNPAAPGQSVTLTLAKHNAEPGESVGVTVMARQALAPTLHVLGPDHRVQTLELTQTVEQSPRYVGALHPTQPGVYQVEVQCSQAQAQPVRSNLAVYENNLEQLDPSAQPQTLRRLAEAAGGRLLGSDDAERFLRTLTPASLPHAVQRRAQPNFAQPVGLAIIMICLGGEWFLRRRWGLT